MSAQEEPKHLTIFDLPAELRVEIYKLVLENVIVHILPLRANSSRNCPHALIRTSRQVRNEVLPLIHSLCPIRANVTDFDFSGMLAWIQRIPSSQEANLCKNQNLRVMLCTTSTKPVCMGAELRKWLHMRADQHRPQPAWEYKGAQAQAVVANDLRRRCKRMPEMGKRLELLRMLDAMRVVIPGPRESQGGGMAMWLQSMLATSPSALYATPYGWEASPAECNHGIASASPTHGR
ncbi:hypothetical protein LTR91_014597 [Friedmanniomyces endolithicus]|nr:hypothetical protein LTR91_014597 [Friedmanniomyces endolithicus]